MEGALPWETLRGFVPIPSSTALGDAGSPINGWTHVCLRINPENRRHALAHGENRGTVENGENLEKGVVAALAIMDD